MSFMLLFGLVDSWVRTSSVVRRGCYTATTGSRNQGSQKSVRPANFLWNLYPNMKNQLEPYPTSLLLHCDSVILIIFIHATLITSVNYPRPNCDTYCEKRTT